MAKLESEKEQSDSQQANNWWRRIYENLHNLGSAVATAVSDLKPTKPNLSGTGGEGRCSPVSKWFRSEIFKVILVYWFFCAGLALIIAALSLPEWFILRQTNVIGHIGFFRRCVYSRRRNNPRPNCYYEIISETAAPLTIFLVGILFSWGVVSVGIYRVLLTVFGNTDAIRKFRIFKKLRLLILLAGLSNMTAIIIFSYLYHNFLLPIRASYVLGWTSCLLMMLGSSLSYCFSRQESEGTLSITPENNINGSNKAQTSQQPSTDGSKRMSTQAYSQQVTTISESSSKQKAPTLHGKTRVSKISSDSPKSR